MKFLKHFFINTYVLVVSSIIAIVSFCLASINDFIYLSDDVVFLLRGFDFLFLTLLLIALFMAYKRGESSYQKTLIGIVLTLVTYIQLLAVPYAISTNILHTSYEVIKAFIAILSFFIHIYLQMEHEGDKYIIKFIFVLYTISLIMKIYDFFAGFSQRQFSIYNYLWSIGFVSCYTMIICIETRITKYKIIRSEHLQSGTWTKEEKEKLKKLFKI